MGPNEADVLISLTRLRLASAWFLPGLAWFILRAGWQARRAPGFRGLRLLLDRRLVFWTATAWDDLAAMRAYRGAGAHRAAMPRLAGWCDEAGVTRWTGPVASMGDWSAAHRRMVGQGETSHLRHPGPAQATRAWPAPRLQPMMEMVMRPRNTPHR